MKFRTVSDGYLLVLQKGEDVMSEIVGFCTRNKISAGWLSGLGAVLSAELGFYQLETHEYDFTNFDKELEVVSLTGNISLVDRKPFVHAHVMLSDRDNKAFGGHLKSAIVGGTLELHLKVIEPGMSRTHDNSTGLNLLDP